MKRISKLLSQLMKDERGQSTTEYILMLAIVVMIAMKFRESFLGKLEGIIGRVGSNIDKVVDE